MGFSARSQRKCLAPFGSFARGCGAQQDARKNSCAENTRALARIRAGTHRARVPRGAHLRPGPCRPRLWPCAVRASGLGGKRRDGIPPPQSAQPERVSGESRNGFEPCSPTETTSQASLGRIAPCPPRANTPPPSAPFPRPAAAVAVPRLHAGWPAGAPGPAGAAAGSREPPSALPCDGLTPPHRAARRCALAPHPIMMGPNTRALLRLGHERRQGPRRSRRAAPPAACTESLISAALWGGPGATRSARAAPLAGRGPRPGYWHRTGGCGAMGLARRRRSTMMGLEPARPGLRAPPVFAGRDMAIGHRDGPRDCAPRACLS